MGWASEEGAKVRLRNKINFCYNQTQGSTEKKVQIMPPIFDLVHGNNTIKVKQQLSFISNYYYLLSLLEPQKL